MEGMFWIISVCMYVQEHIFESDGDMNCNAYLLMGKYIVVCKSNSYLQGLATYW